MKRTPTSMGALLALATFPLTAVVSPGAPQDLDVLALGEPRAFFFRSAEGLARSGRFPFDEWNRNFSRLNGIMGKVLDEEIPGTAVRNLEYFTRFKQQHPRQAVLLHFNGNARDPRWDCGEFFAGHWIYRTGCRITQDLPAQAGEMEVAVENAAWFKLNVGRYRDRNDDIGICELGADGKPDWLRSEQLELLGVDMKARTLKVRRAAFNTSPRAFRASQTYIAPHAHEGPWGKNNNLLWYYNYSTACPRDAQGRACVDVLVENVARRFLPGGELAAFDGVEFDVLFWSPHGGGAGGGVDCDGDGQPDDGVVDGVNTYGIGVYDFCRRLREKLGPGKLLMADGHGPTHQRSFAQLNGLESEGWPALNDLEIGDWSGGLNRHSYWQRHSAAPAFSYINYKFIDREASKLGGERAADVPLNITRLVLAAGLMTDSAITLAHGPPKSPEELTGIFDELVMGTARRPNWLGKPAEPPRRLALRAPDLLAGQGTTWPASFVKTLSAPNAVPAVGAGGKLLKLSARVPDQPGLRLGLPGVDLPDDDLFVHLRMKADPMKDYPAAVPRLVWVRWQRAGELLNAPPAATGMALRGKAEGPIDRETGATVRQMDAATIADEKHRAVFCHPPYLGGTGYVFWEIEARIPAGKPRLEFFTGLSDTARATSDGVRLTIDVRQPGGAEEVFSILHKERRWVARSGDLSRWAGQTVRLRFTTDVGPADNSNADQAYWGDVRLEVAGRKDAPRKLLEFTPARIMTWAGGDWFESGFYFREVGPGPVEVALEFEGGEPVYLAGLTIHSHCDAMTRLYEHGLVLANPGLKPYSFNLAELYPGEKFQRLSGSPKQDPATNNGAEAGPAVNLGPRDALFLIRK